MARVAIIGAGTAGLACAWQLEQLGVAPDIFEQRSRVGELFDHVSAHLQMVTRPLPDPLAYLRETYKLEIKPLNPVKSITVRAPHLTRTVTGPMGHFFWEGPHPASVESQLLRKVRTPVQYSTQVDLTELIKVYDYVVVADGSNNVAKELGCWHQLAKAWIYGVQVKGAFDPHELVVWLNRDYCNAGYVYMAPFDPQGGIVVFVVTDIRQEELDEYWRNFVHSERLDERFQLGEKYQLLREPGYPTPHRLDNIYLVGNAAGALEPLWGNGLYFSLVSGLAAARSIALGTDYEQDLQFLFQKNLQHSELRKAMNRMDNNRLDWVTRVLGAPVVRQVVYRTNFDATAMAAGAIRLIDKLYRMG